MEKKLEEIQRATRLLEKGVTKITVFGDIFVAYSTRFLGTSPAEYKIDGKSTKNAKALGEFCYGYDGLYHQLQLMSVYQMTNGKKFASNEIVNGLYAYWEIIE